MMVTETRVCAQCGAVFTPRREHARFCSAGCRLLWHLDRTEDPIVADSSLQWSVPAMTQAIRVLAMVDGQNSPAAYAAISDAVWAVTMVDAAMMRRHSGVYDEVLAGVPAPGRRLLEETLAGLRFVRNRIPDQSAVASLVVSSVDDRADGERAPAAGVMGWQWQSVPTPVVARRRARAQAWELARYDAYQARLAGRSVGEGFRLAEVFLVRTAAGAAVIADIGARPDLASVVGGRGTYPAG